MNFTDFDVKSTPDARLGEIVPPVVPVKEPVSLVKSVPNGTLIVIVLVVSSITPTVVMGDDIVSAEITAKGAGGSSFLQEGVSSKPAKPNSIRKK